MAIDRERLSSILAEDAIHGIRIAAARAGVTERTLFRYRKRLDNDDELSELVSQKKARLLKEWEGEAIRFMHKCLAKMGQLVEDATVENLRDVNGAAKIVGELMVAKGVLSGGRAEPDIESQTPTAPPSGVRSTDIH
jgi:hypothetical protein